MKTYNIGFSGPSEPIFQAIMASEEPVNFLKVLEGIKVIRCTTDIAVAELLAIPGVTFVEEDTVIGFNEIFTDDWHIRRLGSQFLPIPVSKPIANLGLGSTIFVLDTPLSQDFLDSEEMIEADIRLSSLYSKGIVSSSPHGELMTSLIVGKTVGVSPKASVVSVPLALGTTLTQFDILEALDAILLDPQRPNVSVLLCSWGIPKSRLIDTKITELQDAGIVVVAAAGNSGVAADTISPAGLDSVVGVGASDAFDRVMSWGTGMSNWGPEVDVFAPGVDVTGFTKDGFVVSSGTSLSAAVVAAVAGQIISRFPEYTAPNVQKHLTDSAVPDILFWDGEVYETTPNRLVQSVRLSSQQLWKSFDQDVLYVKRGEKISLDVFYTEPIVKAAYGKFQAGSRKTILPFSWIKTRHTKGEKLRLNISPDDSVDIGQYIVIVVGYDENNQAISSHWIRVGVFGETIDEIDETEELYVVENDKGETYVEAYSDCCDLICFKGTVCCSDSGDAGSYYCTEIPAGFCC